MILRRDRASEDDAIFEADVEAGTPAPISLYHTYGQYSAESTMTLTVAEFRWLVEDAGPRLLAAALNQKQGS